MADETTPQSSTEQAPASDQPPAESQEEASGASTLEDVEAYWRKRMSNSDKAHAAERKVLQEQLESVKTTPGTGDSKTGEASTQALQEMTRRLEQAELRATAAELRAKYPTAVEAVGGNVAAAMEEARLAALNESLNFDASVPKRVDNNNPARTATEQKTPESMSLDELKQYIKTLAVPGAGS